MTSVRAPGGFRRFALPPVRGAWTEALYALLGPVASVEDPLTDDDLQLALYLCYELHYADIEGVDPRMEWSPVVLMFRAALEAEFERAVRAAVPASSSMPGQIGTDCAPRAVRHRGAVPEVILEEARRSDARAIVVGRGGGGAPGETGPGPVAAALLREARCAVLVAGAAIEEGALDGRPARTGALA